VAQTYFKKEFDLSEPADSVRTDLLRHFTPRVARWGYAPREQAGATFRYVRRYTPGWAIACAILLFPLGLLFLLAKRDSELVVNLIEESRQKTQLVVVGAIPASRIRSLETYPPTAPPPDPQAPATDSAQSSKSSASPSGSAS
jgi:hypothetical protein